MDSQKKTDSIISYLAATAPALFQLIAVISVGLVEKLKLDSFVLKPDFVNLANFIVVLLSISLISLSSFWDYNKFGLLRQGENIFDQTQKFWRVLKSLFFLSVISSVFLIGILSQKENITVNLEFWAFFQWLAYIISLVSISFIIYAFALLKIQEKNAIVLRENYIPRLLDSLRRYGHIKNPDIVIDYVDRNKGEAIVKLGGSSKYKVCTDFTGEMISIEGVK